MMCINIIIYEILLLLLFRMKWGCQTSTTTEADGMNERMEGVTGVRAHGLPLIKSHQWETYIYILSIEYI